MNNVTYIIKITPERELARWGLLAPGSRAFSFEGVFFWEVLK